MSLANGRHYLAIPGPSVMPDRVLQAMHRPAPNIYTGELIDMVAGIVPDLKTVADTGHNVAMYIANGHGAWEAALTNTLSRGDTILILATGRFCLGWGEMATALGITAEIIDFGHASAIDMDQVAEALAADKDHKIKAVLAVQVDTASSVKNDIPALRRTLDAAEHPALLFSDNIACLGCDEFHMDDWGVDLMVTGSQKGLMTPPGMSFVYFNAKADAARDKAGLVTPYWDWRPRIDPDVFYRYFCGTAPTHHIYGLRVALDMILKEEGLKQVWARHATLARAVWTAFDTWGQGGHLRLNIADAARRSHAVTTVNMGGGQGAQMRAWMSEQAGVTLGIPLGMDHAPDDFFRIGHMGHVNAQMVLGVLGSLQAGMAALQIPHEASGLAAATEVIAGADA
ncbi:alanine--glyoxylate aminotransferase family protein [Rhodophyticola sp. CCM32]|uniref:pyridoxal-phosphate-dependent aminotransferase family protein n=1 Tax=Rhodophyticola sp. CCM32 TaxID=2916397 RepID=UPI00107FA560|nr:aminotransferase class V-fold PLP-dependent enzyme [Rhodophyticola sp. CCM32]QBY00842.1 alanine--glyoxylate aminotransferase family protein [Rhodophyticola sp. CCM32]